MVNSKLNDLNKGQTGNTGTTTSEPQLPEGYTWAKDSDFEWRVDCPWYGEWRYIGTTDKVAIPHTIQGEKVFSYRGMFFGSSVSGVYSDNPNVVDMGWMFSNSDTASLDLSNFDTSKVENMSFMFYYSKATSLDLSKFNISKVTNMGHMFAGSKTKTLDLSSFDTSSVLDTDSMFKDSLITEGYARTQEDLDRLNTSSNKPSALTFKVKP